MGEEAAGHTGHSHLEKVALVNSQPKYKLLKQIWDRPGKSSFGELTAKVQTDAEGRAGPQFYRCQKLGQVKLARDFCLQTGW